MPVYVTNYSLGNWSTAVEVEADLHRDDGTRLTLEANGVVVANFKRCLVLNFKRSERRSGAEATMGAAGSSNERCDLWTIHWGTRVDTIRAETVSDTSDGVAFEKNGKTIKVFAEVHSYWLPMPKPLYKYLSMEGLKQVLETKAIRFTQPSALNDPFELVPRLYVPPELEKKTVSHQFDLHAPRRKSIDDCDPSLMKDRYSDEHSRKLRALLDQEIGFLCLSRHASSLLMWAHYADDYTGAVMEFDGNHEFFFGAFDIHYTRERPKRDVRSYIENPVPISELCSKPLDWQYETEVRVARRLSVCRKVEKDKEGPIYLMDIPLDCITSVILGERSSGKDHLEVYGLIKDQSISGFYSMVNYWDYELERQPMTIGKLPVIRALPSV